MSISSSGRPHGESSSNEKNTEKLSCFTATQFYIRHQDSKFAVLQKPITEKKEISCQDSRGLKMLLSSGEDESATTDR